MERGAREGVDRLTHYVHILEMNGESYRVIHLAPLLKAAVGAGFHPESGLVEFAKLGSDYHPYGQLR